MAEEINKSTKSNKNALAYVAMRVDDEKPLLLLINEKRIEYIIYIELLKTFAANYDCGYYLTWDKNAISLLRHRVFCSISEINSAIEYLVEEDYFDKEIFNKYQILTNKDAQNNWMIAARKRANFLTGIVQEIILVDYGQHIEYYETKTMKRMSGLSQNNNSKSTKSEEEVIEIFEEIPCDGEEPTVPRSESSPSDIENNTVSKAKQSKAKQSEAKEIFFDSSNQITSKEVGLESMPVLEIENKAIRDIAHNDAISSFELEPPNPPTETKNVKSGENSQKTPHSKKTPKPPHPARAEFIKIWEAETGLVYVSDFEVNTSIASIMKKFEGYVRGKIDRKEIAPNNQPIEFHMAEMYRKMWQTYTQLNDWQRSKFETWVPFNKNFDDLALAFNRIWGNDKPKIVKLEPQHPSFQKVKFS